MKTNMKKRIKAIWNVTRPVIVVVAFYLLFKNVEIDGLWDSFFLIQWWTVVFFLICALNAIFFQGLRWWVLIRAFTDKLTFLRSLSIHFSSTFYSLILPNSTVQEVVRTVYATKTTGYVIGWSSAWISKIMGIVISFSFSALGLLLLPDLAIPSIVFKIVFILFFLMCIAIVLSFTKKVSRPVRMLLLDYFPKNSFNWLEKLREGIYRFKDKKQMLFLSFMITVGSQMFLLGGVSLLLLGITGHAYFKEVMAFIPLVEMISMAQPFTPGGVGVRETLVAVMFRHLRLSNEQLAMYVLLSNLSIFLKLIGAIPVLYGVIKKRKLNKNSC